MTDETTTTTATETNKTETAKKAPVKKAAKKAPVKKAAKKTEAKAKSSRGHVYELTTAGLKQDAKELSTQQAFIYRYLKSHGNKATTLAITTAAESAGDAFPTNQPHARAVAFYMTTWKSKGWLKFAA